MKKNDKPEYQHYTECLDTPGDECTCLTVHGKKFPQDNGAKEELEKLVSDEKISEAIEVALSAPFPQVAVHHLIDKVIEIYQKESHLNPESK